MKILVLCVSWFARKLVYRQTDRQTDRHGENISVFFPMRKKALKRGCLHAIIYSSRSDKED